MGDSARSPSSPNGQTPMSRMSYPGSPPASGGASPGSAASSFLPKLLTKLSSIEERLQACQTNKVEESDFKQHQQLMSGQMTNLSDQIRNLRQDMNDMHQNNNRVDAMLAQKADLGAFTTLSNKAHEDHLKLQGMADGDVVKQMQADAVIVDSTLSALHQQMADRCKLVQLEEQSDRIDVLCAKMMTKADGEVMLQLQSEVVSIDSTVDKLGQAVRERATVRDHQQQGQQLKNLALEVQGKGSLDNVKQLLQDMEMMKTCVCNLEDISDRKAPLASHEMLKNEVADLLVLCKGKGDGVLLRQLQSDMVTSFSDVDQMRGQVLANKRILDVLKSDHMRLDRQHQELTELSNMMNLLKADADKVPQLDIGLLDQL